MKFGTVSVREDRTGRTIAFFCTSSSVGITRNVIAAMIRWSREHDNRDLRVCLHQSRYDRFHQMIILHHRSVYRRPHRETREESYHIIKGTMAIYVFHPNGSIQERIVLDTKHTSVYRMGASIWHVTVPLSPVVIFHEAKVGPISGREITFAPWAPENQKQGKAYMKKLLGI